MGVSPSILPPARVRELGDISRWPPPLQDVQLEKLCRWYTAFREIGTIFAVVTQLASVLGLSDLQSVDLAGIWQVAVEDRINMWEVLTALAATSFRLSSRTKLAFFFRMWDIDNDNKLDVAEVAFLLRALIYGLGRYCSCTEGTLPEKSTIGQYVERTFKEKTSEDVFIAWAMRHRLLRSMLRSFTSSSEIAVDVLDFRLKGPTEDRRLRRKALTRRDLQLEKAGSEVDAFATSTRDPESRRASDNFDDARSKKLPEVGRKASKFAQFAAGAEKQPAAVSLKAVLKESTLPSTLPRLKTPIDLSMNAPANMPMQGAALGRLRMLDMDATCADLQHKCPLHQDMGRSQCLQLSKHEVLLANRLWHFFKENKDLDFSSVRNLLKLLKSEVSKLDSLVTMSEHRNIFKLTDTRYNRFFEEVVRRLRNGENVSFHRFLQGVCPCASDARIRLFKHWHHHGHWFQEQAFTKVIKAWRKTCEDHWKKPVMQRTEADQYRADIRGMDIDHDGVLSINDMVEGALVSQEVAEEIMAAHDINKDHVLNENEYIEMFCRDGMRGKSSKQFETLMRNKFKSVLTQWVAGNYASTVDANFQENSQTAFQEIDGDGDGGLSLDELVGYIDLPSAFNFMDAYDDDHDTSLSFSEFQHLVDPSQTISSVTGNVTPSVSSRRAR